MDEAVVMIHTGAICRGVVVATLVLTGAGISVDFHSFLGPHTIDVESVVRSAQAMSRLASSQQHD